MIEVCNEQTVWDEEVLKRGGHPLQLWGWGEVKAAHNWQVERVFVCSGPEIIGVAQILLRPLPKPFNYLAYIPRGPAADQDKRGVVLEELAAYVKSKWRAVALTVEPGWETMPSIKGWRRSSNTILIPRTLILDLKKTQDELLAAMPSKRRYDIRKSSKGITDIHVITSREELAKCLELYKETARRAGFALHEEAYYEDIFEKLGNHSKLIAVWNQKGQPLAFTWLIVSKEVAFELYGGINEEGHKLRANYALKWWCITHMQQEGVHFYDFNGLLNDGISTFKRGFADHEDMLAGTYDKPLSAFYPLWNYGLPMLKNIARKVKSR